MFYEVSLELLYELGTFLTPSINRKNSLGQASLIFALNINSDISKLG